MLSKGKKTRKWKGGEGLTDREGGEWDYRKVGSDSGSGIWKRLEVMAGEL